MGNKGTKETKHAQPEGAQSAAPAPAQDAFIGHLINDYVEERSPNLGGAVWSAIKSKLFPDREPTRRPDLHSSGFHQTLLFNQFHTSDKIVAACAAVSQAIYSIGENTALLVEASGHGATSFFLAEEHMQNKAKTRTEKIHDYIPDDTVVELVDTLRTVENADDYQAINIRWAGASGYIRKRHISQKFGAVDADGAEDYEDHLRRFLDLKGLEKVQIIPETTKSMQPNSLRNPCAVCVLGIDDTKVCIVGWGGTDISKRPLDVLTDIGATPAVCPLWHEKYPAIQAHSSMVAQVQGDFVTRKLGVLKRMKETNCNKLIFTGHSLGGGCALLAHLITLGQQEKALAEAEERLPNKGYKDLKLDVESIVFAAPAPFYEQGVNEDEFPDMDLRLFKKPLEDLRRELIRSSTNFVCHYDMVPRLPHNIGFVKRAAKEMLSTLASSNLGDMLKLSPASKGIAVSAANKVIEQFSKTYIDGQAFQRTTADIKKYRHLSKIAYLSSNATCEQVGKLSMQTYREPYRFSLLEHRDTGDSQAYMYYFACHMWFPQKVKFSETAPAPGTSSNDNAAAAEEMSRGQSSGGLPYPSRPSRGSLVSEPSSEELARGASSRRMHRSQ